MLLLFTVLIVGLFGGIYILLMAVLLIPYFREKKLLQWGRVAPAVILKEEEISGRQPTMTATYQLTDEKGEHAVWGRISDLLRTEVASRPNVCFGSDSEVTAGPRHCSAPIDSFSEGTNPSAGMKPNAALGGLRWTRRWKFEERRPIACGP